jgi:MYXO-CTERM domain-containing protein
MSNLRISALAAAIALGAALPGAASAFTIDSVAANGNGVDTSWSTASMLSVEIDAKAFPGNVSITVGVESGDPDVLRFNALLRNLVGLGLTMVDLQLGGASFAQIGGAAGTFGSLATVSGDGAAARIKLAPPEFVEVAIGDWFLDGQRLDFGIRLPAAGQSFTLGVSAVPEPGTWAMWAAGLMVVAGAARRRRTV